MDGIGRHFWDKPGHFCSSLGSHTLISQVPCSQWSLPDVQACMVTTVGSGDQTEGKCWVKAGCRVLMTSWAAAR